MEKSIWQILKEAPLNDEEGAESMGDWEQVEARILEIVQKEGFDLTGSDSCESLLHYPKGWYQGDFPF